MKLLPLNFITNAWPYLHPHQRAALLARFIAFQVANWLPKERRKTRWRAHWVGRDRRKPGLNWAMISAWVVAVQIFAIIANYPNPRFGLMLASGYGLFVAMYILYCMGDLIWRRIMT